PRRTLVPVPGRSVDPGDELPRGAGAPSGGGQPQGVGRQPDGGRSGGTGRDPERVAAVQTAGRLGVQLRPQHALPRLRLLVRSHPKPRPALTKYMIRGAFPPERLPGQFIFILLVVALFLVSDE